MAITRPEPPTTEAIPQTYRAAVVHRFHDPLNVDHVPRVALDPGQVRVKVEAFLLPVLNWLLNIRPRDREGEVAGSQGDTRPPS